VIRLVADENLNDFIVRGVLRRLPDLDILRIRDTEMRKASDVAVLEWAAAEGRVVLTHDVTTMTKHAYERLRAGKRLAGVFEIGQKVPVAVAIEEVILIAQCSLEDEWQGQVRYLPLR
jgi:hypothetical protein